MSRDDGWTPRWVAGRLQGHHRVTHVETEDDGCLVVTRTDDTAVLVGTLSTDLLEKNDLTYWVARAERPAFVVNVSAGGRTAESAFMAAEAAGFAIGGMGDLYRALGEPNPARYVHPEVRNVSRMLRQHSRVESFRRLDDRKYCICRRELDDIVVAILNEYELTAEAVRAAVERYGRVQGIVNSNPLGGGTRAAFEALDSAGIPYFAWSEFYKALHKSW